MKKSLQLFLVLMISFFLVDRFVYSVIKNTEKKVYTGQAVGKVNHFFSVKDSANVLVFGSSRANHHVDIKLIDSASFNMGVNGTRLGYAAALISTLKKKDQTVLVHLDPNMLFDPNYKGEDILSLLNWSSSSDSIKSFIYDFFPEEINISNFIKCYTYNGKVLGIIKNRLRPGYNLSNYYGFDPIYPTDNQKVIFKKILKKTKEEEFKLDIKSNDVNPLIDQFLKKIINKCISNNSKLIFFTSPTCKKLTKRLRTSTKSYFKSIDAIYLDYSEDFNQIEINTNYWKDLTHMSHEGAAEFSKKLLVDIYDLKKD